MHRLLPPLLVLGLLLPAQKPPKEEAEDPVPKKPKFVPVDDGPTTKPAAPEAVDLAQAARQATHPEVRQLYRGLAVPHDRLTYRSGLAENVEPLRPYVGKQPLRLKGPLKVRPFDDAWAAGPAKEVPPAALTRVDAYEEIARARVEQFLGKPLDQQAAGDHPPLTTEEFLLAAETALAAVLRQHEKARTAGLREGDGWGPVGQGLRDQLLDVRLRRLDLYASGGEWGQAAALARRLAESGARPEDRKQVGGRLADQVREAVKKGPLTDDQLRTLQAQIARLEDVFPGVPLAAPVDERLRERAQKLYDDAQALVRAGRPQEAGPLLRRAEQLFPRLPGLRDYRLKQEDAYPVLRVGVRDLPERLLPGLARTDSERLAVELLFEGLVQPVYEQGRGQRYLPGLSLGPPQVVPLGREFRLPRDAYWSDDKPVTAADVTHTVRLLKDPKWPGYRAAWAELVDDAQVGGDPHRVTLTLRQGCVDPLALMSFKVLPQRLTRAKAEEFAARPVGSGPFQYQGRKKGPDGREFAHFAANPAYGSRADRLGLPFLREIHFVATDDPAGDLGKGLLDLAVDVPSDQVKALQDGGRVKVVTPPANRRVYFLAVNHRKDKLKSADLRRALALAIDREDVLDSVFRADLGKGVHQALPGPYPAKSWAYEPRARDAAGDALHNPRQAKLRLADAGLSEVRLSLKYPTEDPRTARAVGRLRDQLEKYNVRLELQGLTTRGLIEAVEQKHDYELAYYWHDFADEAYWLWPLLDPDPQAREPGGSNYLGYHNDSELESLFRRAARHRDFRQVQQTTWLIAQVLEKRMPLVPLWQLDRHLAYRADLAVPRPPDPLLVFTEVERWRYGKRE